MQSRFRSDRRLTVRMSVTLFLLGLLYVAFVAALIVLLKSWVLVVVVAAALLGAQYWFSDRIALFAMHGRIVEREEYPELHAVVDRLCAIADMPKPVVAVSVMDMPNAFATGRNPDNAVVCVTTGLLRRLEPAELEGVLAHELSHVAHKDVAVITIASFLGVIAGLIVRFAFYSQLFGGARRDQNTAAAFAVVMGVAAAVYAISFLLIRALSRYRELAADRAAALLTGRPSALASALTKVSGDLARIPTKDLRTAQAFNAFYFTPATGSEPGIERIFSTHPPLAQRIAQLQRISAELGEAAKPGEGGLSMGLLDILLGRTKPVAPDLDQLFGLPSAAVTLEAAAGFTPTGTGAVCFATVEGAAFAEAHQEVQALLDADTERTGPPVELTRDEYGYSWLVSRRTPDDLIALVADLHAVNSALESSGFGPQLLCSVAAFEESGRERRLGLVYLYKRGTFYPFAPLLGGAERRDNALELQIRAVLENDLRVEQDLSRWFPIWGAPGLG